MRRWGIMNRTLAEHDSHVGFCSGCGYSLHGLTEPRCPECARTFDPEQPDTWVARPGIREARTAAKSLAWAALVSFFLPLVLSVWTDALSVNFFASLLLALATPIRDNCSRLAAKWALGILLVIIIGAAAGIATSDFTNPANWWIQRGQFPLLAAVVMLVWDSVNAALLMRFLRGSRPTS